MSTITVLTSGESGANSLIDINNNFAALNADKLEKASGFYAETVTGTINSSNKTFTVSTTIAKGLLLVLGNSSYQETVDYTTSGTTITMVTAPDSSLSGQPFWLLHT